MSAPVTLTSKILDRIVALIQGIDGPDEFHNDFNSMDGVRVSRHSFGVIPTEAPSVHVRYRGESIVDDALVAAYGQTKSTMTVGIVVYTHDVESTAENSIDKLLYDIRKRLLLSASTRQLEGNAFNTYVRSISEPVIDENGYIVCEMTVEVEYFYKTTEPSQIT